MLVEYYNTHPGESARYRLKLRSFVTLFEDLSCFVVLRRNERNLANTIIASVMPLKVRTVVVVEALCSGGVLVEFSDASRQ